MLGMWIDAESRTVPSQGLPAPPLDVYLRYRDQRILLSKKKQEREEEQERQEVDDAAKVSTKALLATDAQELPPPTAMHA